MHGFAVIAGAVSVTIWLYLLVARGRFWMVQRLEADVVPPPETGLIAVIIPARNEAEFIAESLTSLLRQSCAGSIRIFLVDDNSTDGTAATAREAAASTACADALTVISGQALLPLGRIFDPVVNVWHQSLLQLRAAASMAAGWETAPFTSDNRRRRPFSMSRPRSTRMARRWRLASDSKSPSACACLSTPKVNFSPGISTSLISSEVIWMNTPLSGPPLCNCPVECRKRGP